MQELGGCAQQHQFALAGMHLGFLSGGETRGVSFYLRFNLEGICFCCLTVYLIKSMDRGPVFLTLRFG